MEKVITIKNNGSISGKALVSVIVPVYKVEKYIYECLASIKKQTYENFECIVIDDGSPDNSGQIAETFARGDSRFRVIHQENAGVGVARNAGYDASSGKFVCFVDSDDFWEPDYLEYFVGMITQTDANIALSLNYFDLRNTKQIEHDDIKLISSQIIIENIFYFKQHVGVWNKIYSREYLDKHHIRHFPFLKFGEGMTFNIYALQHTKDVAVGLRRVYHYRYNFDSATRKFTWNDRRRSGFLAFEYMEKAIVDNPDSVKRAFACHVWWSNFWICLGIVKARQMNEYRELYKEYKRNIRKTITAPLKSDDALSKKAFAVFAYISPFLAAKFLVIRELFFIAKYQIRKGTKADE